jgi:hypothetical protein
LARLSGTAEKFSGSEFAAPTVGSASGMLLAASLGLTLAVIDVALQAPPTEGME